MKYRYKLLLGVLFVICAFLSTSIEITTAILVIVALGWVAYFNYKCIKKYFGGNFDVSKSASLTQRALTLGWALTIFIAGSLIISVVLKYLLSIKVYFKFT